MASPGDMTVPKGPTAGRFGRVSAIAAWVALAIGTLVLVSYPAGLVWLRSTGRPLEAQFNTGVGIGLVASALLLGRRPERLARVAASIAGLLGAALGAATLAEHVVGLDLGVDQVLHRHPYTPGVTMPGRMGPPAAATLLAMGCAALLLATGRARHVRVAQALALALLPVGLLAVVGHTYDVALLYSSPTVNAIAAPTAVAILLLQLSVLFAHPERGMLAGVAGTGTGSAFARRMLGYALALPFMLGGLVLLAAGSERGPLAVSALVVAMTLAFAAVVLRDARVIDRLEEARRRAQRDRAASREELAQALAREREARAQAEAASRAKDQFLATLSHELRTPLNAILGWALLMRDGRDAPARDARGLAAIERNARALAGLVSDLLDVSRVAAGTVEVAASEPADLRAAVERALSALRPDAEARGVTLAAALPSGAVTVPGDAARLEQVAWNLGSNAVKFSPRGERVDVSLRVEDGEAILEVRDHGPGMDAAFLARVFEPFVQEDGTTSRRHGGLGIGLAITRTLVVAHGGRIAAESGGPGRGACFRVTLPGARLGEGSAPGGDLAEARVLVVDDDGDSREVLLQLLASWGARPLGAASAREALDALGREPFDVILSDIAMPGEDGHALVAELRRIEEPGRRVPAAALTAFSRPEDRARALAAGFDAHLAKPIEPAALRETLGRLVHRARGGRAGGAPLPPSAAASM